VSAKVIVVVGYRGQRLARLPKHCWNETVDVRSAYTVHDL